MFSPSSDSTSNKTLTALPVMFTPSDSRSSTTMLTTSSVKSLSDSTSALTATSFTSALRSPSSHFLQKAPNSISESISIKPDSLHSNTSKSKSSHLLRAITKLESVKATVSAHSSKPNCTKSSRSKSTHNTNPSCRQLRKQKRHQKYWVPSLGLLQTDKMILSSQTDWLNDTIINGAQSLLCSINEQSLQGFQNTLLGQGYLFRVLATDGRPFVQILHINNNHWVTVTDVGCEPGHVYIYDSMHQYITLNCKKQICSFLKPRQKVLKFCFVNMQSQTDSSSCGLFAIAVATAITYGKDPSRCKWDVTSMRQHLLYSFENQKLEEFPTAGERSICQGSKITKIVEEQIFCKCRAPNDSRLGMIQCAKCQEWYHLSCVSVPPRATGWTCTECV